VLPAALRYLALIDSAEVGAVSEQVKPLVDELVAALGKLDEANSYPEGIEGLELAEYARDNQIPAMAEVREVADRLEKVVADDLWPLPKYSEILFIK
jgi:glutamine synthetase